MNTTTRPRASLTTRQLVDLELGLFLLQKLHPTAPPTALPALLRPDTATHGWTPQQQKYLNRGRLLLAEFANGHRWRALLDAYATAPTYPLAFDISHDRSRFAEKSVGFSRNRIAILRKMLA
jgi:hypothetical protein